MNDFWLVFSEKCIFKELPPPPKKNKKNKQKQNKTKTNKQTKQ